MDIDIKLHKHQFSNLILQQNSFHYWCEIVKNLRYCVAGGVVLGLGLACIFTMS